MPIRRDIITTTNWYAWTVNGTVYYTLSATPSVGDTVYDSNKQDTGKTISAVGSGTITFSSGGDNLYAWTITDASLLRYPTWATTFYTKTVPASTTDTEVYKSDGTSQMVLAFVIGSNGEGHISSANESSITITCVGPD